jgi:hypothetical protein
MAAAGGLAMTRSGNHDDSYSQGLVIAFRMITVAIGITVGSPRLCPFHFKANVQVGLFGSGLLIYSHVLSFIWRVFVHLLMVLALVGRRELLYLRSSRPGRISSCFCHSSAFGHTCKLIESHWKGQ